MALEAVASPSTMLAYSLTPFGFRTPWLFGLLLLAREDPVLSWRYLGEKRPTLFPGLVLACPGAQGGMLRGQMMHACMMQGLRLGTGTPWPRLLLHLHGRSPGPSAPTLQLLYAWRTAGGGAT
eukprot:scaffold21408_cov26-Tisochrysis_lutea.AAC.2